MSHTRNCLAGWLQLNRVKGGKLNPAAARHVCSRDALWVSLTQVTAYLRLGHATEWKTSMRNRGMSAAQGQGR